MTTGDRVSAAGLAFGASAVVACLAQFWGANPGYADRFLVLLGAGWAVSPLGPGGAGVGRAGRPLLGGAAVVIGGVAFAVGLFLVAQIGPRTLALWWLAVAWLVAASGALVARQGVGRWRVLLFPLAFTLFALPVPTRVLNPLQHFLQNWTTAASFHALATLGFEVARAEFVLELPGGRLRVEEACSGVRSVTALTAIAAFVGFLRGFGPARGALLVLLAVPVIAAVNVLRVALSGLIQEGVGAEYIVGAWHEALGFAMIFVGLGLILGLARLLGPPGEPAPVAGPVAPALGSGRRTAVAVAVAVALGVAGVAAGYHTEARAATLAPLDEIPLELGGWTGEPRPVPEVVNDLLSADRQFYRVYTNNVGAEAHVWVFYWDTKAAIKGYHHPDVCWGNKGFAASNSWVETLPPAGEAGPVAATAREFRHGVDRQVVLYWTQEGRTVWTDADENDAKANLLISSFSGHQWVGRLLGATTDAGPRLQAVLVVPGWGPATRRQAAEVARLVAGALYAACPWAAPESIGPPLD
jgi:EpsI family protein